MELDRTKQPSICPMETFQIQRPEMLEMPNGIPVRIFRAGEEEVVRLDIMIRGGLLEQTQPLQAVFTARMLREGTARFSSAEIAEKLDYYGAWLDVSSSMTHSFLTLYTLNKYFAQTFALLVSMLKEPTFPEREFAVVVDGNRQQFLVNREKVEVLARKELNIRLFGRNHPFGRYAELEDYERITTAVLRTMHQHYYCAKNCTCYLSGYVTDEILKLIESELGQDMWGSAEGISPSLVDCLPESLNGKRCFIERPEALQSAVRMGCFTVDSQHPDFLKLRFMVTLFGGYFGSRLMKNIREDKGYTYGIGAGLVAYPFRNMLVVNTQAANEYANEVIREVNYEMERLQAELVSSEELDMVKNYVMGDMCRSYESPFSMADAYIFLETSGLSDDFFTRAQQTVADITAEDVRDMACKYLRKESFTEVIAGKKCDEMNA